MGLNLSQVYVHGANLDDFTNAVLPAWSRSIESDTEPRRRQLLILVRDPWLALVDSTGDLPKPFALELSRSVAGDVIRTEVSSKSLTAGVTRAAQGEAVDDHLFPPADPDSPMPLYVDPEMEVWNALQKLGVPPELRLLRVRDIAARPLQGGEQANLLLLDRKAPGAAVGHGLFFSEIKEPRTEESGPHVEFSIYKSQEKMLADLYIVTVAPDPERVDNLLQVLESIARRKPRPPLHHYKAAVTPDTEDEARSQEALAFLRDRYRELAKTRPLAFSL
jgi:hypothetical protein